MSEFYHFKRGLCGNQFRKVCRSENYFKYSNMEVVRMTATPFTPFYHRVNLVISTNGSSFTVRSLKEQEAKEIYELLLYNCYIK